MKYYTTNRAFSSRARDILTRILFVLIAAALIFFSTVFIGHYLLRKAEEAGQRPSDTSGAGWSPEKKREDPDNAAGSAPNIRACGIYPLQYKESGELDAALQAASVSYDSVLYPLSGSDGSLIYQSPSVCELARVPLTDRTPAETVQSAVRAAKMRGLRVLVSVTPSEAVTDKVLFGELASWGVDEILVTPNFSGAIDYESANLLRLYLIECAEELDPACRLGTVLPADSFLDHSGAMQLQMIAQVSSSLGIRFDVQYMDPDADVYENVYNSLQALMGSFSVYNMRVVIDGDDPELLAAQYRACVNRSILNFIFTSTVDYASFPEEDEPAETEPEPEINRPAQPAGVVNPYASTGETYEQNDGASGGDTWQDNSWQDNSWQDNSWEDNSWEDNSWQDSSWEDSSWEDNSWEDNSWEDNSWEDNSWQDNSWQDNSGQDGSWEDNSWQDNSWQDNSGQDGSWEDNSWQDNSWQDNSGQDGSWEDNSWQDNSWQDNSWQDNSWQDNSWQDNSGEWWGGTDDSWTSWEGQG